MKRTIDCVFEISFNDRFLLRFYPRRCRLYKNPSCKEVQSWDDIVRNDIVYSIIKQHRDKSYGEWQTIRVYDEVGDQNGAITELPRLLDAILCHRTDKTHYKFVAQGEGSIWNVNKSNREEEQWSFAIFEKQLYIGAGAKFFLNLEQIKEFKNKTNFLLNYLIQYSDKIIANK